MKYYYIYLVPYQVLQPNVLGIKKLLDWVHYNHEYRVRKEKFYDEK